MYELYDSECVHVRYNTPRFKPELRKTLPVAFNQTSTIGQPILCCVRWKENHQKICVQFLATIGTNRKPRGENAPYAPAIGAVRHAQSVRRASYAQTKSLCNKCAQKICARRAREGPAGPPRQQCTHYCLNAHISPFHLILINSSTG
jgi:hypothetical protein